jgi:hypothetical protein
MSVSRSLISGARGFVQSLTRGELARQKREREATAAEVKSKTEQETASRKLLRQAGATFQDEAALPFQKQLADELGVTFQPEQVIEQRQAGTFQTPLEAQKVESEKTLQAQRESSTELNNRRAQILDENLRIEKERLVQSKILSKQRGDLLKARTKKIEQEFTKNGATVPAFRALSQHYGAIRETRRNLQQEETTLENQIRQTQAMIEQATDEGNTGEAKQLLDTKRALESQKETLLTEKAEVDKEFNKTTTRIERVSNEVFGENNPASPLNQISGLSKTGKGSDEAIARFLQQNGQVVSAANIEAFRNNVQMMQLLNGRQ